MLSQLPASVTAPGRTVYVDSRIVQSVIRLCNAYQCLAYSGKRIEPGSDHNCGAAVDFIGSNPNQKRLYAYALTQKQWWVEPWCTSHTIGAAGTTGPQVHISFFRCGSVPKNTSNPTTGLFNYGDYRNVWLLAGGSKSLADVMAAIGYAESKGNPRAHCHNCVPGVTEDSRGLWQINIDAHPQYRGWNLYEPITNAKAADEIVHSQGLGAWSTYKNGTYKDYLKGKGGSGGTKPHKSIPGIITGIAGDVSTGLPGVAIGAAKGGLDLLGIGIPNPVKGVESAIGSGFQFLGEEILYSIIIMGGAITGIVGLVMIGVDIGFVRHQGTATTLRQFTPSVRTYKPAKVNQREYRIGVARGEAAKARSQGYREGKEGATVAVRTRGKTPKVVGTKALQSQVMRKKADKMGSVPF